jgi:hypothetical protein
MMRQIMNRDPVFALQGTIVHPIHTAWHSRDILPILCFAETLGTSVAQAKLLVLVLVLVHYLTEGRWG